MKKKILALTFAGIALAGGLTACGTSNNTETTQVVSSSSTSGEVNTNIGVSEGINIGYNEGTTISIPGEYTGKWCKFVGDTEQKIDEEFSLVLNEDGTGKNKRDGQEFECTWEYTDGTFKMTDKFMGITIDYTGKIEGKELHIYNGEPEDEMTYEYVYEKK